MTPVHAFAIYLPKVILILSYHLRLGLPSGPLNSDFPSKILYTFLINPMRATYLTHLILLDSINLAIFYETYKV